MSLKNNMKMDFPQTLPGLQYIFVERGLGGGPFVQERENSIGVRNL